MKRLLVAVLLVAIFCSMGFAKERPMGLIQTSVTVTGTAANIYPENLVGRYVLIQNNHATGILYINLSGTATVSDTMFKLLPTGSLELFNITNAISAIGSIASNPSVAISEGK